MKNKDKFAYAYPKENDLAKSIWPASSKKTGKERGVLRQQEISKGYIKGFIWMSLKLYNLFIIVLKWLRQVLG